MGDLSTPEGKLVERLRTRMDMARRAISRLQGDLKAESDRVYAAERERDELKAEVERLREALKPFATLADDYLADNVNIEDDIIMAGRMTARRGKECTPPRVTFADFRAARAALRTPEESP